MNSHFTFFNLIYFGEKVIRFIYIFILMKVLEIEPRTVVIAKYELYHELYPPPLNLYFLKLS